MSRAARKLRLPRPDEPLLNGLGADGAPAGARALVLRPRLAAGERADRSPEAQLEEALGLARAIDLDVIGAEVVPVRQIRPSTLFASGRVRTLGERIKAEEIALVVVDARLGPVQQRNLERAWSCKVIDRTGLILEIFGERAKTREGSLQVELAALTYQRSRLVRSWTHLERQRGGFGFLGGPGEAQIELDRRRIDERILTIERELAAVRRTRGLHREARRRVAYPVAALVGYTNAGKSTLFNRLTGAAVDARDQLFATLDPTMRRCRLPSGQPMILSDTVGFIADLPTGLVAAFRATLEEVRTADLVLHVRDIAHPEAAAQQSDVLRVLADLGLEHRAEEGRLIEFWNKLDLVSGEAGTRLEHAAARQPNVILGSACTGRGVEELLAELDRRLAAQARILELELEATDGARLAWLYRHGNVLARSQTNGRIRLRVALMPAEQARLARQFPPDAIL